MAGEATDAVEPPIACLEAERTWCDDDEVLDVSPGQIGVGFQGERDYAGGDRSWGRGAWVVSGAVAVNVWSHNCDFAAFTA